MTLLFPIMTLLYHLFFCKCQDYYFSLFHYLQKDYYITYDTSIISLIFICIYYCCYCYYHTIICIIFSQTIIAIISFEYYYVTYFVWQLLWLLWLLSHYYLHYFFSSIIAIISFEDYYVTYCFWQLLWLLWLLSHYDLHYFIWDYYYYYRVQELLFFIICFPKHYLHYCNCVDKNNCNNSQNWYNSYNILLVIPAHKSGIWLQILGLTAGMHSYTSEASIAAKILRIPVGQCTSVLADTRLKQAFSTVFDSPQQHDRDTTEPHLRPND